MATRVDSSASATTAGGILAVLLARVVVPAWLTTGAVLKFADPSPTYLPVPIIKWAGSLGIDLMFVLQFSIAVELIVAGVMLLLPGLARPVGLAILGLFLPVLLADVLMGSSSCGCFGSVQVHPGITLAMDLSFFLGLWLLGRHVASLTVPSKLATWRVVAAGLWSLASVVLAFGLTSAESVEGAGPNSAVSSGTDSLPAEGFYLPDYQEWIGSEWSEVPISRWIRGDVDVVQGLQYVLFYRKDCEHCHELMEVFFAGSLPVPTTAVAVPERGGFPTTGVLDFPCGECRLAELPTGVDWFLQTPVLVRLRDGVVECAAEVVAEDPTCLEW